MTAYITDLRDTVDRTAAELTKLEPDLAARRPGPARWSIKEIVGHLIDSAANNHQRFVRAPSMKDLVFDGYDQDAWVAAQRYQDAPWPEVVVLWRAYNLHIARVMEAVSPEVRDRVCRRHNLDRIAWRVVPAEEPTTLGYLMEDYVGHLHHHLRQIRAILDARSIA